MDKSEIFGKRYKDANIEELEGFTLEERNEFREWAAYLQPGWLVLFGPTGTGKTHIAAAITDDLPGMTTARYSERMLIENHISDEGFPDCVIVDHIGIIYPTQQEKKDMEELLSNMRATQNTVIICTDLHFGKMTSRWGRRVADEIYSHNNIIVDLSRFKSHRTGA